VEQKLQLVTTGPEPALDALLHALGRSQPLEPASTAPADSRGTYDPAPRLHRQFDQLVDFTQKVIARSPTARKRFWLKTANATSAQWTKAAQPYRDYVWRMIGRHPDPSAIIHLGG
jgi:hypothetical protein